MFKEFGLPNAIRTDNGGRVGDADPYPYQTAIVELRSLSR
jgi:hypothetical protein